MTTRQLCPRKHVQPCIALSQHIRSNTPRLHSYPCPSHSCNAQAWPSADLYDQQLIFLDWQRYAFADILAKKQRLSPIFSEHEKHSTDGTHTLSTLRWLLCSCTNPLITSSRRILFSLVGESSRNCLMCSPCLSDPWVPPYEEYRLNEEYRLSCGDPLDFLRVFQAIPHIHAHRHRKICSSRHPLSTKSSAHARRHVLKYAFV